MEKFYEFIIGIDHFGTIIYTILVTLLPVPAQAIPSAMAAPHRT